MLLYGRFFHELRMNVFLIYEDAFSNLPNLYQDVLESLSHRYRLMYHSFKQIISRVEALSLLTQPKHFHSATTKSEF